MQPVTFSSRRKRWAFKTSPRSEHADVHILLGWVWRGFPVERGRGGEELVSQSHVGKPVKDLMSP